MSGSTMLIPKPPPKRRRRIMPALPDTQLNWLAGRLGPKERRALREICQGGDLFKIDGRTWLLAPVSDRAIDTLAAFEAEAEDREPYLDDEPDEGREEDRSNDFPVPPDDPAWIESLEGTAFAER